MTEATSRKIEYSGEAKLTGRRFGRYEILAQIAQGGMGTVHVARSVGVAGFERLVAVKVLHPHIAHEDEFVSMFLDEARLAARIRHPNVVATLDISDSDGEGFFLVMDYIEGDHLGALLKHSAKQQERLPPGVVSRIVLDALRGLGAAHNLTDEDGKPMLLVHRDVSPHNVLVGSDGIARLTDFGIAKADVRLTSTREGQFKGKVTYMAPEQAVDGTATQKSDLFSAGIVLWESLTGTRLFHGENHAVTLYKILEDPIPPPSSVEPTLAPFDAVIAKALARPPEERYESAEEFALALEKAAADAGGVAQARTVGETVMRYAGAKIEAESRRVREAIGELGRAQVNVGPRPSPRGSSPDAASVPPEPPAPSMDATIAEGALVLTEPAPKRGRPLFALAAIAVALLGAGALVFALRGQDERPPAAASERRPEREPGALPTGGVHAPPVAAPTLSDSAEVGVDAAPRTKGAEPAPASSGKRLPVAADRPKHGADERKAPKSDGDLVVNPYRQ